MTAILRWRRPATMVALIALAVEVIRRGVLIGLDWARRGEAGPVLGPGSVGLVLTLAVGLAAGSGCREPAVPGARGLARWGVGLAAAFALTELATIALGLLTRPPRDYLDVVLEPLSALAVPALVTWGLLLVSRAPSVQPSAVDHPARAAVLPVEAPEDPTGAPSEEDPDPEQQPTWSADAASGAVWRTAGEAARGAPGSSWGASGWTATPDSGWAGRDEAAEEEEPRPTGSAGRPPTD